MSSILLLFYVKSRPKNIFKAKNIIRRIILYLVTHMRIVLPNVFSLYILNCVSEFIMGTRVIFLAVLFR